MYEIGDLIVYGSTGVCRVTAIGPAPGGQAGREYYTLTPLYQSCVIYAPTEEGRVFMRPVISKQEAQELVAAIPGTVVPACPLKDLRQLTEHYENAIKSHDCTALVHLTMSIYQKRQEAQLSRRKLGQTDERFMKKAESLLFGELAAALDIGIDDVPAYIAAQVAPEQVV